MSNATSGSASVTEVSVTSTVSQSVSTTVLTTTSTFTSDSSTFTATSETTSSSVVSVSSVYVSPSTIYVPPSTTLPSVVATSSTISVTENPASTGGTGTPSIVYITSTAAPTYTPPTSAPSTTSASSSASSSPSALSASGSGSSHGSGGLSTGATIAIAVVIPIVAIALAFCLGLFLWRRRKARKSAEEQRKNEIEEYGFNPNNDPSLAPVAHAETGSEMAEDNSGYRGWGTTSNAQRKPSTTLGSGSRHVGAAGAALSESSSNPGGNVPQDTPPGHGSDGLSGDTLTRNGEGIGAAAVSGAAVGGAAAGRRRHSKPNIHRGLSNASSAYSTGHPHSEISESELAGSAPAPYYHEEGPYNYIDAQAQHGPYGDGTYGTNGEPVIRNVQARRNTRIERAPAFQQNAGIAQNF